MKNTLILLTSNRNVEKKTMVCIEALQSLGARRLDIMDVCDIALARNVALTKALEKSESENLDIILMVDDDMTFDPETAQKVIDYAREHQVAASAGYVSAGMMLAAHHYQGDRWLTGLGFLALPRQLLREVSKTCRRGLPAIDADDYIFEFCSIGLRMATGYERVWEKTPPEGEELMWGTEDFCFTRKLGGVVLLPLVVGHIKKVVLQPEAKVLQDFIEMKARS